MLAVLYPNGLTAGASPRISLPPSWRLLKAASMPSTPQATCMTPGPVAFSCRAIVVSSRRGSKKSTNVSPMRNRIDLNPCSVNSSVDIGLIPKLFSM